MALSRNFHAAACAKDSRIDSHDSITKFFFTDSIWGLRGPRLKLGPRVAGLTLPGNGRLMVIYALIAR
jgi:hypothetical protein